MLLRSVESVLNQSILPGEIIIVNDGSKISYDTVLPKLDAVELNIVYEKLDKSVGPSIARNRAASKASGNILMFLDDDDIWYENKIESQLQKFNQDSEIGLIYTGRKAVDQKGNKLFEVTPNKEIKGNIHRKLLIDNYIGGTSMAGIAIKKSVFERAGGFDPKLPAREDYDLWIRATKNTLVCFCDEVLVEYTVHSKKSQQLANNPQLYLEAKNHMWEKYSDEYQKLSPIERRKSKANYLTIIADKNSKIGSRTKYKYILLSLLQYPSIAAISRLIPYHTWIKIRSYLSN